MTRFSIIIVTYNSGKHLKACLESIIKQDSFDYEVIAVDNASCDGSRQILQEYRDRLRIKDNDRNLGFPEAVNIGISMSQGRYILTLNPDVVLESNFLTQVSNSIDGLASDVGMVGVKILKPGSERLIDSTGLVLSRWIRFSDRGAGEIDRGQYDRNTAILGPCGAAAIYKRDMLEDLKIGGEYFDKDFFYLIEDFDIALRALKRKWKCLYLPGAVCYHQRNGCGTLGKYRQYYSFRNRYFLIIKLIDIKPFLLFVFLLYDLPRFFFRLLTNPLALGGIINVLRSFKVMFEKRKNINKVSLAQIRA